VLFQDIEKVLEPILYFYKQRRRVGEPLGDFTERVGLEAIREYCRVCTSKC
jgi:sulfite reductase (ferredoxin)